MFIVLSIVFSFLSLIAICNLPLFLKDKKISKAEYMACFESNEENYMLCPLVLLHSCRIIGDIFIKVKTVIIC